MLLLMTHEIGEEALRSKPLASNVAAPGDPRRLWYCHLRPPCRAMLGLRTNEGEKRSHGGGGGFNQLRKVWFRHNKTMAPQRT